MISEFRKSKSKDDYTYLSLILTFLFSGAHLHMLGEHFNPWTTSSSKFWLICGRENKYQFPVFVLGVPSLVHEDKYTKQALTIWIQLWHHCFFYINKIINQKQSKLSCLISNSHTYLYTWKHRWTQFVWSLKIDTHTNIQVITPLPELKLMDFIHIPQPKGNILTERTEELRH